MAVLVLRLALFAKPRSALPTVVHSSILYVLLAHFLHHPIEFFDAFNKVFITVSFYGWVYVLSFEGL